MGNVRKLLYVMLCGMIFFSVMPAVSAETDPITLCMERYKQQGMSYDEAKRLCTANVTPTVVQTATQYLPDLVVQEIYCAPGNKLAFSVANMLTPIPPGWTAVADVYINGVKKGSIDLGRPTGGDITVGSANYLTAFDITETVEVKVVVDPTNSIKETDEGNNAKAAKLGCELAATATVDPVAECIAKNQQLRGMSYDEAKKLCAAGQTPADASVVINRCGELEKKLNILIERLKTAQGQDAEGIVKDILTLKTELRTCQAKAPQGTKVVTAGIKNPCDEVRILKDSIAQLEKKMMYLKELGANKTVNPIEGTSGDLPDYSREYNYLRARLEKMSFACQQGKPIDESPCARLSGLEMMYKEINDKLAGVTDDKSAAELKDKLASIVKEIEVLKQKCREEKLNNGNVGSLIDLENAYRAKQKAIVEGASDKDMQAELAKVEDEKKKLLEALAVDLAELDARQITIIKKLQIKDGQLIMDDIKMKARKVKLDMEDREIEIESAGDGTSITDGAIQAQGDTPLDYTGGALVSTKSGKEIKMMPGALMKDVEGQDYIKIDDEITWLPVTIVFQATQLSPQPDPPGVTLPAGTKGEKLGPGHYRFLLPDGQMVELSNYDRMARTGDVSISGKDGAATTTGMKGSLTGSPKPKKSAAAIAPSGLKELILKDDGTKPEYFAKVDKKGKILGIIPTTISTEYRISAETGDVAGMSAPWWGAIATTDPDPIP